MGGAVTAVWGPRVTYSEGGTMKKVENGDRGCDVLLLAQAMAKILQEKIEVSMNGELTEITYAEALPPHLA